MDAPRPDGHRFLPEVEGLRAVAAVLVAVYHVFLGRVSGGVDVFFVIAGFLITTSLLTQTADGCRVCVGRYIGRLMVRLLPIAILVLGFVIVGTILWMPATRQASMLGEVAASALYAENWALAAKAVDYTAREELKSPVQHFWAMSVQGQFYVLWLLLFGAIGLLVRPRRSRAVLAGTLGALFAGSLAWSIWLTSANQPLAYFHTGVRVWEFAAGGLLALAIDPIGRFLDARGRAGVMIRGVAGWAGLALIVSCGLVLSVSRLFPGAAALWPVGGALLVVIAAGGGGRFGASRVLASAPFVFVGGIAYALYLWHWPVLTFARLVDPAGELGIPGGIAVLVASFALAAVSTRLVERPIRIRLSSTRRPWRVVSAGVAALCLIMVVSSSLAAAPSKEPDAGPAGMAVPVVDDEAFAVEPEDLGGNEGIIPAGDGGASPDVSGSPAASPGPGTPSAGPPASGTPASAPAASGTPASTPGSTPGSTPAPPIPPLTDGHSDGPFKPDVRDVEVDVPAILGDGCQQRIDEPGLVVCERGDANGTRTAMLIGGSHAAQWYPALNAIARRRGWTLLTGLKAGCRVTQSREFSEEADDQSCKAWLRDLLRYIERHPPDFVITTGTATNPRREWVPSGYLDVWRTLGGRGIPVIAIRDTPRALFNRVDCLALRAHEPWRCDIPRSPTLAEVNPLLQVGDLPPNVIPVDLSPWLCTADTCPAVIGHRVVYRDGHHLAASFTRTLTPMIAAQIPKDPVAAVQQ